VTIKDCVGFDLYFIGLTHSLENAEIQSRAARAFWLAGDRLTDGQVCNLRMKNVRIQRVGGGPQELRIGKACRLRAEGLDVYGAEYHDDAGSGDRSARLAPSAAIRSPNVLLYANTIWQGDGNILDLNSLRVG